MAPSHSIDPIDPADDSDAPQARALDSFLGYVVRRTSVAITERFMARMQPHGLRPLTFTLLLLIRDNPGITSAQLCQLLDMKSSNVVVLVRELESLLLVAKQARPQDKRAFGLHLTPGSLALLKLAEQEAYAADIEATHRLSPQERQTLHRLLRKGLGLPPGPPPLSGVRPDPADEPRCP
jgi:DNA-binding MarR family transcriptional regulator